MRDKRKQLIITKPLVTAFPYHADLFSVISDIPTAEEWIMNYLLQLRVNKIGVYDLFLDFATGDADNLINNCPFIKINAIERNQIDNIIEAVIAAIDEDKYIYVSIDRYYIRECDEYNICHMNHDMLISGYDKTKEVFIGSDFFVSGKYETKEISFSEFRDAYDNYNRNAYSVFEDVLLITKRTGYRYKFNEELAMELLCEYMAASNTNKRFYPIKDQRFLNNDRFSFGIEIYEVLIKNIGTIKEGKCISPIRSYHVLYEHKKLVFKMLNLLLASRCLKLVNDDIEAYRDVILSAERVRNLILKYHVIQNEKYLDDAICILKSMKEKEKEVFEKVIKAYVKEKFIYIPSNTIIYPESYLAERHEDVEHNGYMIRLKFFGNSLTIMSKYELGENILCLVDGEEITGTKAYEAGIYQYKYLLKNNFYHTAKIISKRDLDMSVLKMLRLKISSDCQKGEDNPTGSAVFVKEDWDTGGNWQDKYGKRGIDLVYHKKLPEDISLEYCGLGDKYWSYSSTEDTTLANPIDINRIAACKFMTEEGYIEYVAANGGKEELLTFYVYNWKDDERDITFNICDYDKNEELLTHRVCVKEAFAGVYVTFKVSGKLKIKLKNNSKYIAVISGLFFD